jgi:CHAD domain-containing protein/CYTH domain-containing protein
LDQALLDEPAPRAARVIALELLGALEHERDGLAAHERDAEALHDFRVALRRVRSWIRAWRPELAGSVPRGARRRLRRIARESNAARDAEVIIEWIGESSGALPARARGAANWLRKRFERQQREAEVSLEAMLSRDFAAARDRLEDRLRRYRVTMHVEEGVQATTFAAAASALLRGEAGRLRERLDAVRSVDDHREAHRARISGKRLRYLFEPLAPHVEGGAALVAKLKGLQDALGALHDAHIWLVLLRDVVTELAAEKGRRLARDLLGPARREARSAPAPSVTGLASLGRLARERAEGAYGRLVREWSPRRRAAFFRELEAVCAAMEERGRRAVEIERKYLLSTLPPGMPTARTAALTQGYLPGTRLVERVRMVERDGGRRYFRTVKVGTGLVRRELEEETSVEVFDALWPLTLGRRLTKRRHAVPDGGLVWEIDEFTDRPLVLAEVELPTADAVVELPEWLAPVVDREVTGDPAYLNLNLAR